MWSLVKFDLHGSFVMYIRGPTTWDGMFKREHQKLRFLNRDYGCRFWRRIFGQVLCDNYRIRAAHGNSCAYNTTLDAHR